MSKSPTKTVSKVPEVTPELLTENERRQEKLRKKFTLRPSSQTAYAHTVINSNLEIIKSLETFLAENKRAPGRISLREKIAQVSDDTAIWAVSVGQFALAASLTNNKHQRAIYRDYEKAIHRDDSEWCKHPIFEYVNGNPSQVAYREFDFLSPRHARTVSMVRCNVCGFRNAKDLDAELKKLKHAHERSLATAKPDDFHAPKGFQLADVLKKKK